MQKLRLDSWLSLAKGLDQGRRKRVDHVDCGEGKTLLIQHDERGYSAVCFRCNAHGAMLHGYRNLAELQAANYGLTPQERNFETNCSLPTDIQKEIPDEQAIWLYKAGIFKSTAERYGFGWSSSLQRIILPVYENEELVYIQARSTRRKPKYLNSAAVKGAAVFKSQGTHEELKLDDTLRVCCITEDILSSVRVGCFLQGISTLGTTLSDAQAAQLEPYSVVLIWYDGDSAGIKGSTRVARTLHLMGKDVRIIRTESDPKLYSNREMRSILQGALCN